MSLILLEAPVSVFFGTKDTDAQEQLPLGAMLERVKTGAYRQSVEKVRYIHREYPLDAKGYAREKRKLHGFTPSGTFAQRAKDRLTQATGLVHFDFDRPPNLAAAKATLMHDPYVVYVFVSPGGEGLKLAVWTGGITDDASYKAAWGAVLAYFDHSYPAIAASNDASCKDLARMCFVSWDEALHVNQEPRLFEVPPAPAPKSTRKASAPPPSPGPQHSDYDRAQDALRYIAAEEYKTWLDVGMALHDSGEPWARSLWDSWSQQSQEKYDARDQDSTWASFTPGGGITMGTLFKMAKDGGYRPPGKGQPRSRARGAVPLMGQAAPAGVPPEGTGTPAPDRPTEPPHTLQFLVTKDGRPRAVTANVEEVLMHAPAWRGVLGFDELCNEVMLLQRPPYLAATEEDWRPRPLRDNDAAETSVWLQRTCELFLPTSKVAETLTMVGGRFSYHVIRDYLISLTWDGQKRLDEWLPTYCHAENTAYTCAVGRSTLIGAVARVCDPGCKVDTVLILEGEQGTLKSTMWRTLASDPWFSDTLPMDLKDKDAYQVLRGKWIIEVGELAALRRSDREVIKRYLSATTDHYRPSYGRQVSSFPRMNIFVGTTNQDEYLSDETGNRRFWPVALSGLCDIAALARDRDQLWAEAYLEYLAAAAWHLTPELEQVAIKEQEARMETDDWEDPILKFLEEGKYQTIITRDLLRLVLQMDSPHLWTQANQKRVGRILRHHGWKRDTFRYPTEKDRAVKGYRLVTR